MSNLPVKAVKDKRQMTLQLCGITRSVQPKPQITGRDDLSLRAERRRQVAGLYTVQFKRLVLDAFIARINAGHAQPVCAVAQSFNLRKCTVRKWARDAGFVRRVEHQAHQ